jgi:leader peptidase (prepilin peptidase)/N-methyltransferase
MAILDILTPVAAFAAMSVLLVDAPRRLFAQVDAAKLSKTADIALSAGLLALGLALYFSGLGHGLAGRWSLALTFQILAAVTYADLRFLVIPDLYSVLLVLLAVAGAALTGDWVLAALGALVCGGLLAAVGYGFRRLRGIDGLGLGDVKLAAALGGLLGPVQGARAIALAAVCASLVVAAFLALRRGRAGAGAGPMLAPFGAALAMAAGAVLLWSLR